MFLRDWNTNRLIGKRSILAICANLVVLAIYVVLATAGVLTNVGVSHQVAEDEEDVACDPNIFAIPGLIWADRLVVAVEMVHLFFFKKCFPSWWLARLDIFPEFFTGCTQESICATF